jgi:ankyrin repeat protein
MYTDMLVPDAKYGTPLQEALMWGNPRVISMLLDKGADPNIQCASFTISRISD